MIFPLCKFQTPPSRGNSEPREAPSAAAASGNKKSTVKSKLASALSPESNRRKKNDSGSGSGSGSNTASPQRKKKLYSEEEEEPKPQKEEEEKLVKKPENAEESAPVVAASDGALGIPLSPSINFIDAAMTESQEEVCQKPPESNAEKLAKKQNNNIGKKEEEKVEKAPMAALVKVDKIDPRLSVASSTDEGVATEQSSSLVISAQVHRDPMQDQEAAVKEEIVRGEHINFIALLLTRENNKEGFCIAVIGVSVVSQNFDMILIFFAGKRLSKYILRRRDSSLKIFYAMLLQHVVQSTSVHSKQNNQARLCSFFRCLNISGLQRARLFLRPSQVKNIFDTCTEW